jgi:hypothetical protein
VAERIPTFEQRAKFWYALLDSNAIILLRRGEQALFEAKVQLLLTFYAAELAEVE